MALAAFKLFKYYRPAQVHVFSSNEYAVNTGFKILAQSYGIDVTKQREFQKSVDEWDTSVKKVQTSKAMVSYLSRAKEQDEFMKEQEIAYQIGKRHLANMMGEDPNTFTQDDVDRSIEYLFPSAIFDKKAKPLMKPPHEVFPIRKAAEFDESGRPHDFLFYTGKPAYFKILFDIWTHMKDIEKYQDALIKKKVAIDQNEVLSNLGYTWLTQDEFQIYILETIREKEYENFILTIERLMAMPYSTKYADFVNRFRKRHVGQKTTSEIPQPQLDISGRAYVTTFECLRKSARGDVTIRSPGTGLIQINGKDITYFDDKQSREQVLFPLVFTDMLNHVDIECNIEGGGFAGQAGAIRWGIAWTLRSFVDMAMVERMRLAGLLTRDKRLRERKKPGQPGARKKHTWKKR